MDDERVYEGTSRGKPVYFVSLDRGEYEITIDKKTLTWKKAMYFGSGSMMDGDYYGVKEFRQFRLDHPGVYEYAARLLSKTIGKPVPIPKMVTRSARKKVKRRLN